MAGDDEAGVDPGERLLEPLRRRGLGEDRPHVVVRRGVAVEDAVQLEVHRPALRPGDRLLVELRPGPVVGLPVAVSAHEARFDRADELRGLGRLRAEEEVAAEDDRVHVLPVDVGEDRLERDPVAVDVVQRCDAQATP
jgi:hypothetical protein